MKGIAKMCAVWAALSSTSVTLTSMKFVSSGAAASLAEVMGLTPEAGIFSRKHQEIVQRDQQAAAPAHSHR